MNLLKSATPVFVVALGLTVGFGSCSATTINFDDVGGSGIRQITGDRYLSSGVQLSTNGVGLFVFGPAATNTPPDYLYASTSPDGTNADASIIIDFVLPLGGPGYTDQFSFAMIFGGTGSLDIKAFGAGGSFQGGSTEFFGGVVGSFSLLHNTHRLVLTPTGGFLGIDTLTFGDIVAVPEFPVPEPSTFITVLGALLAGCLFRPVPSRARRG